MSASIVHAPLGRHSAGSPFRFGHESAWREDIGEGARQGTSQEHSVDWLLKRNCSLAPRQLLIFYVSLCVLSCAIGVMFWFEGAPFVLPFAWVELIAVGAALLAYARHAADSESIHLQSGRLIVECVLGRRVDRVEFAPAWVRVEPEHGDRSLIELSGQGRHIAVGRFVRPELRRQLAEELRWALRRWQSMPAGDVR